MIPLRIRLLVFLTLALLTLVPKATAATFESSQETARTVFPLTKAMGRENSLVMTRFGLVTQEAIFGRYQAVLLQPGFASTLPPANSTPSSDKEKVDWAQRNAP